MKSKTSLFSPGLSRNILSRFWPLWLIYLGVLLVQLPVAVSGYVSQGISARYTMECILQLAVDVAGYAMAASLLSVMAVFSYLYSKRSCSLINSLPVRRETAFVTACLTGLLPLLLAELLTWLIALGVFAGSEIVRPEYLNSWLLIALLSTLASYGFGVFCAMLTGHIMVLPALFLVLNAAVYVLEALVQALLRTLVYGYDGGSALISRLSPLPYASSALRVIAEPTAGSLEPEFILLGIDSLAVYAVVGMLFIVPALLLYRRRKMEAVGDVVAIKALEPVFKYCASIYAALGLGALMAESMDNALSSGPLEAAVLALMLLLGAALGYYAAEMLLQKSLRVFRSRIRGLIVVWAVFLLGVVVAELDLTGYERRVPETEEIQSVVLVNDGRVTEDAESIKLTRKIHQTAIDNEEHNRQAEGRSFVHIRYELKDGSSLSRSYWVDGSLEWIENGNSEFALCRELYMLPQNKELMMKAGEIKAENVIFCDIEQLLPKSDEFSLNYEQLRLSPQQAEELYTQCILPDTQDSMLGTRWFYMDEEAYETRSDTSLYIHVESGEGPEYGPYVFSVEITLDAERSIAWLEENLGIEVKPYLEVRPDALEDLEYY